MNDFFTSFYVTEKYHFGMDDTVLGISILDLQGITFVSNMLFSTSYFTYLCSSMNIAKQITAYLSVEVMSKNIFLQPAILYVVLSLFSLRRAGGKVCLVPSSRN